MTCSLVITVVISPSVVWYIKICITVGSGGGIPLQARPANQKAGLGFQIYSDENAAPALLPETTGEWKEIPKPSAFNKENRQKPGVWTSAKVSSGRKKENNH